MRLTNFLREGIDSNITTKLFKMVNSNFKSYPEKTQKMLIRVPGLKGKLGIDISAAYKEPAKPVTVGDKKFLKIPISFDYQGLGLHPANNRSATFYITKTAAGDKYVLTNEASKFSVNGYKLKLSKQDIQFLDTIFIEQFKTKKPNIKENRNIDKTGSRGPVDIGGAIEGMSKAKAKTFLYKGTKKFTHNRLYKDEYWQGPHAIFKQFDAWKLNWHIDSSKYRKGEARMGTDPMVDVAKEWLFTIYLQDVPMSKKKFYGQLIAAGAGSVSDPLEKYDLVLIIQ